jgi:hypothetical protein
MIHCRDYRSLFPLTPSELCRLGGQIEESPNGCWTWKGYVGIGGYGRIFLHGAFWQVHRIVYELFVGPVPEGCVLHHRCRNKRCCNPAHLQPATQAENLAFDGALCLKHQPRRLKTWCRNGHELSDHNIRWRTVKGKRIRVCLACEAAAHARRNERRRSRRAAAAALRSSTSAAPQVELGSGCGLGFPPASGLQPKRGRNELGGTASLVCPSSQNPAKI